MLTLHGIIELRDYVKHWHITSQKIAFVPTMGNLHAGHLHLVDCAHEFAERVAVSIFVNPLQFGPNEDFKNYPRTLEADKTKLIAAGVDLLFAPSVDEMYAYDREQITRVEVPVLASILDGKFRPGHFAGMATIVVKLFNMMQPDMALFGEKDYQQLAIIRRLVADLCIPVEIIGVPTVREADGLAMSSRNQYLTSSERELAPLLFRMLSELVLALKNGRRDFQRLESEAVRKLSTAGMRPDYVAIRAARTLATPDDVTVNFVVLAAAWLGKTRLIDNIELHSTASEARHTTT
ncbi:MAG TPA: pantoate--beta-alanine ligase [Gammaproteobacteria bacterium]|nr:pantoate--beta-alanine ligase [Gammaproteobacteria bacterium]